MTFVLLFQHQMALHGTTESSADGIKTDQTSWMSGRAKLFEPAHSKHLPFLWDHRHSIELIPLNQNLNNSDIAIDVSINGNHNFYVNDSYSCNYNRDCNLIVDGKSRMY